jgi:UDP-N-acetylglucosamine 2-epimerase (non-hydrolysing)/GDP/UDP-N,N'-diacetylbacillosamine 2-epimerase (hydrolysing)
MTMVTVGVVTGGRADYSVLLPVLRLLDQDPAISLRLIVTGSHLSPEFGLGIRNIEADKIPIAARVEMLLSSDTAVGVTKSVGLAIISFADILAEFNLDALVLMGDRFELLAAAQAALICQVPIVHIAGGDVTSGAYDDAIRHSITKMSHLHLVTNADSRRRVIQLGEDPARVITVGSPALDLIRQTPRLGRSALAERLGFALRPQNFLVTFHPVTLESTPSSAQLGEMLGALEEFPQVGILITSPNQDNESRELHSMIVDWTNARPNAAVFTALGHELYPSVMAMADAIVGNSSSGLYEAPFLRRPTVNIGNRQQGRPLASSVICCGTTRAEIAHAIRQALVMDCSKVASLFGDGQSAHRIVEAIKAHWPFFPQYIRKRFVDIDFEIGDSHDISK